VLLIISMLMTRMLMLRAIAVSSGVAGATYSFVWLSDPIAHVLGGNLHVGEHRPDRIDHLSKCVDAFQ